MDTLRLILFILGALLIGAMLLYYWVTSEKKPKLSHLFGWLKFLRSTDKDEILATTPPPVPCLL